jgi:2-oxoglutarate dehydrogenase E1 component
METNDERERVFDVFRRWGYLQADLDPLRMHLPAAHFPGLELSGPVADEARRYYCGTIGVEFMHMPNAEQRLWIQEQIETEAAQPDRERILEQLIRADLFEQVIQSRYLGTKRFSLEGVTALVPALQEMLEVAAGSHAHQAVLAMSHRGRLNVMVHVVKKPASDIFAKFEDVDPRSVLGGGDVKYHVGAVGTYEARGGEKLSVHLVSNPSHLEAVDPVAVGRARAKQVRIGSDGEQKVIPIVMHGDSAFAGQGILAETLNYSGVRGFEVGGTIHVIVNNLIGFTTEPSECHTSRFASDVAKRLNIPIFHVNAEDPDAVVRVARMAVEYRYRFQSDVVVDLIGYRRHGHSEVDDPTITQPLLYKIINTHPRLWDIYSQRFSLNGREVSEKVHAELLEAHKAGTAMKKKPVLSTMQPYWAPYKGGCYLPSYEVDTGVPAATLGRIGEALSHPPQGFHTHAKIQKLLEQRGEMGQGKRALDYGTAEAMAFGSLLLEGTPIRATGQDTRRGTFNQRHAVLIDVENETEYIPLANLSPGQPRFEIYNSVLSEAAVLGFEYGYSRDFPEALVLWEAQFGDFANGAQIIIDQFISSAEDKWGLLAGVVMLLPHGYEGQGPEHSSARLERFLQLTARDNMQICQPSTAAQYFHMLRRQARRQWRKPLVVFTPKSMLRHPEASSPLSDLTQGRFKNVLPDMEIANAARVLLCTGKIAHELRVERRRRKDTSTAIVTLEQLYPFPQAELLAELDRHAEAKEIVWVQEEPANMGARSFVMPRLRRLVPGRPVRSVRRSASASPATGSAKAHEMEQKTLIALAFETRPGK